MAFNTNSEAVTKTDKPTAAVKAPKGTKAPLKAVKSTKEKSDKEFGATRKYPDTAKVKVLNKENPHRAGTGRAAAFEALKGCKTMGDYYATGNKTKYIADWVESGHVSVG